TAWKWLRTGRGCGSMSGWPGRLADSQAQTRPAPRRWDQPMTTRRWAVVVLAGGLALGSLLWALQPSPEGEPSAQPPWFADVTDEVGLDFTHEAGPGTNYFMPQETGSGGAFF